MFLLIILLSIHISFISIVINSLLCFANISSTSCLKRFCNCGYRANSCNTNVVVVEEVSKAAMKKTNVCAAIFEKMVLQKSYYQYKSKTSMSCKICVIVRIS